MEQLASKIKETDTFSLKSPLLWCIYPIKFFTSRFTPCYIIYHAKFTKTRRKSQLLKKLGKILSFRQKLTKSTWCVALWAWCVAPFYGSFWRPSTHPNQAQDGFLESPNCLVSRTLWIILFGGHFPPSKVDSPKTSCCVSKKWQRGHFLSVFWPFGGQDLLQNWWKFLGFLIFWFWIQIYKPFVNRMH